MNSLDMAMGMNPTAFVPLLSMNAVIVDGGRGAASALRVTPVLMVVPASGQLFIQVRAIGVNRPDIELGRYGSFPYGTTERPTGSTAVVQQ